jgi:hypothetical protein
MAPWRLAPLASRAWLYVATSPSPPLACVPLIEWGSCILMQEPFLQPIFLLLIVFNFDATRIRS